MQIDHEFENHKRGHSVLMVCLQRSLPDQAERQARQVANAIRAHGYHVEIESLSTDSGSSRGIRNTSLVARFMSVLSRWRQVLTVIRLSDVIQVDVDLKNSSVMTATVLLTVSGFLGKRTILSTTSVGYSALNGLRGRLTRRMLRIASAVVTGSESAAQFLTQVQPKVSSIPPSGLGGSTTTVTRLSTMQPRVGVVAPIDQYSLAMLLRGIVLAKQKYPRAELVILTNQAHSRKFSSSLIELSRSGIEVATCESESELIQKLQTCDAYFESSSQLDPSPMLLEAFACRIPVLCSDIDSNTGLIEDGSSGLIVEAGNLVDLANQLCKLVESPELLKSITERGHELAKRFNQQVTDAAWVELYSSVTNIGTEQPKSHRRVSPQLQPAVKS